MSVAHDLESHPFELRSGNHEVRLARTRGEIDAALALRYRVFYEEMSAKPSAEVARLKRDFDAYDMHCDHLLVLDRSLGSGASAVVGTYRLIRRPAAERVGAFYTASEFDISPFLAQDGHLLELGRSCVDAAYRTRPVMQLLWRGIAAYVGEHDIALMFGCASLPGTDPSRLAVPLSYLHYNHLAPVELRARALPHRHVNMALMDPATIESKLAFSALPPLVKGYLRLGGFVGDGAVVDDEFNTTDVCVIVRTELVTGRYSQHYLRGDRAVVD